MAFDMLQTIYISLYLVLVNSRLYTVGEVGYISSGDIGPWIALKS